MSFFKKQTNTQAYLKMGLQGMAGSGKTFTASQVAIGLVQLMRENKLDQGNKPALFLDSETGSDWVAPDFEAAGIELHVVKTRSSKDLIQAIPAAEREGSVLIIDSVTHYWRDIVDTYQEQTRKKYMEFQDWKHIKSEWAKFSDAFVNSQAHIIMCGRLGDEYDQQYNEKKKKMEQVKVGTKMKAEKETGYEPSLNVQMELVTDADGRNPKHEAVILKDRSRTLQGKTFINPTFKNFLPHIQKLSLGGKQVGFDTERDNKMFDPAQGTNSATLEQVALVKQISERIRADVPDDTQKAERQKLFEEKTGLVAFKDLYSQSEERLTEILNNY